MGETESKTQTCKHCKMQIPKGAKICPYCKKKQKHTMLGVLLLIIGILIIIGACSSMSSNTQNSNNDSLAKKESADSDSGTATLEKFNKIKTGMSYDEVVEIMGSDGTVLSEASVANITSTVYYWYSDNGISNMNITISDGKVVSKAQIGLE